MACLALDGWLLARQGLFRLAATVGCTKPVATMEDLQSCHFGNPASSEPWGLGLHRSWLHRSWLGFSRLSLRLADKRIRVKYYFGNVISWEYALLAVRSGSNTICWQWDLVAMGSTSATG